MSKRTWADSCKLWLHEDQFLPEEFTESNVVDLLTAAQSGA